MADLSKVTNGGVGNLGAVAPGRANPRAGQAEESSFQEALSKFSANTQAQGPAISQPLKFSNHAVERMQNRGIRYSTELMSRIENAIDKAQAKGSRDTLVLTEDSALIVSVNNRTVVTVMDKQNLKENVFTKIDSTVVL